jgi:predicted metal-dependent peptidase
MSNEEKSKQMPDSNESKFDLNLHMHRLLLQEPFFAGISRRINKVRDTSIPTAGVWVNPDSAQFEMLYNPAFFEGLTDKQRLGVIKHELYHIIFEHITTRKPCEPVNPRKMTRDEAVQMKVWNYATDCAINSHIADELPDSCLVPGKKDTFLENLPLGKSAETYYNLLQKMIEEEKKKQQNGEGSGSGDGDAVDDALGGGQFDDHGKWQESDEVDETIKEMAKERAKEIMRKAAQEAGEAGTWGTISAEMRKDIMDRITSKIDWRKVLRYFIKTSQRAHKSSTVRRVNKRYRYIHPGRRVNRTAKLLVCIDQSGSVSDKMLATFFGELAGLSKIAEFTVLFFDTEVDEKNVFVWKKGERVVPKRTRFGGTCFEAPTKYVNSHSEYDGCVILTDLEAPKPTACKVPRMWVTDETHASRPYFATDERVIAIPAKDMK